ncbi:MAG: RagB/SusD family nutrient uptake outer membrane protein, partial [Prevotella sp.]|nr:RagB/SusD family nutrient uptake outer membrane protein [Prevotella sp.]
GYRFYDLMCVAMRRNDPSYLANRIYMRRGADKVDEVKAFIGRDLNDTRNWYLNWNDQIGLGY